MEASRIGRFSFSIFLSLGLGVLSLGTISHAEVFRYFEMEIPYIVDRIDIARRLLKGEDDPFARHNHPDMRVKAIFSIDKDYSPSDKPMAVDPSIHRSMNMHLPEKARKASRWAYRRFMEKFSRFVPLLEDLSKRGTEPDVYSTMIYVRDGNDYNDSPYEKEGNYLGTLKVIFPDAKGEIPFNKNLKDFEFERPELLKTSYPLFDLQSGMFVGVPIAQGEGPGRKVGPPAQLAEINGIESRNVTPALLLAAAMEVARRAQDPNFLLPSAFVLHCPEENIGVYKKWGFQLIREAPDAQGLYGMMIDPEGFSKIAIHQSHKRTANILRQYGARFRALHYGPDDTQMDLWFKDRRVSFGQRVKNRVLHLIRKRNPHQR